MSAGTGIEWTDATWNPLTGCTKVSAGCDRCYAETLHERFHGQGSFGTISLHPGRLTQPITWQKPRRIFVNSMSDLFHAAVPDEFIAQVFAVMAATPWHTFQILTKRHARMRAFLAGPAEAMVRAQLHTWAHQRGLVTPSRPARPGGVHRQGGGAWFPPKGLDEDMPWPLPNVWAGVSVENQHWADIRIPALLATPAAVRWISAEPLLGPIHLHPDWTEAAYDADELKIPGGLDWVVAGGESGPGSRPMYPGWVYGLHNACLVSAIPFLFKQWGNWAPIPYHDGDQSRPMAGQHAGPAPGSRRGDILLTPAGDIHTLITSTPIRDPYDIGGTGQMPGCWMRRMSKQAAGRHLDGRAYDQYPRETFTRPARSEGAPS